MKKLVLFLVALSLSLSVMACGEKKTEEKQQAPQVQEQTTQDTTATADTTQTP